VISLLPCLRQRAEVDNDADILRLLSVKRHRFPPGSEPQTFTGNLCEAYEVKCSAHGGKELCPGFREYDPEIMEGGKAGATVWCICECHRKRTRPHNHEREPATMVRPSLRLFRGIIMCAT